MTFMALFVGAKEGALITPSSIMLKVALRLVDKLIRIFVLLSLLKISADLA